jgi:hypothetical protein
LLFMGTLLSRDVLHFLHKFNEFERGLDHDDRYCDDCVSVHDGPRMAE